MKNVVRFISIIALLFVCIASVQAKDKSDKTIYAFAYGTCFNDSVVYVSAISELPEAVINSKTKFLENRQIYSNQFKQYLDALNQGHAHTCAVFFDKKKDTLMKTLAKLRRNTARSKKTVTKLVEIAEADFKFSTIAQN